MAKKDYSQWTKEQLIKELVATKKQKKYGLVWDIEKEPEKVVTDCKEKLPVLKEVKDKEINPDKSKNYNVIIEGDNYHALSVLNYTHKEKIDVIYIDPPYNTGNKDFVYNDKYVDVEDAYRHSKWLQFMEKRLKLAKNLLSKKGIIFISIDDNECAQLKLLCDEIFVESNFVTNIIWQSKTGSSDAKTIDTITEYILVYAKNIENARFLKNVGDFKKERFRFKDQYFNERGTYYPDNLDRGGLRYSDSLNYPITCPDGSSTYPNGRKKFYNDGWTWKWGKEKVNLGLKNGYIIFKKSSKKESGWAVYYKNYLLVNNSEDTIQRGAPFKNIIDDIKTGEGASTIKEMFGHHIFKYSKPVEIIKRLISMVNLSENSIILDFFAGSGTTGQAILEKNTEDKLNRKFILCTNDENNICSDVCYPRIKKVIMGHKNSDGKKIDGVTGNLRYFKTDFVAAAPTDKNKRELVNKCTEMLCLKENAFERIGGGNDFAIFKDSKKYLGIIYDEDSIAEFKKEAKKIDGQFIVYVFSLDQDAHESQFKDMKGKVKLNPIPEVILAVYRRIFK